MLFLNIFSSQFLLCTVVVVLKRYCVAAFVLEVHLCLEASQYRSIYLCEHRSIHTFCKEAEVTCVNVNRCIHNVYRYLQCIEVTTKTELTANCKNATVQLLMTIKNNAMLLEFF